MIRYSLHNMGCFNFVGYYLKFPEHMYVMKGFLLPLYIVHENQLSLRWQICALSLIFIVCMIILLCLNNSSTFKQMLHKVHVPILAKQMELWLSQKVVFLFVSFNLASRAFVTLVKMGNGCSGRISACIVGIQFEQENARVAG